jgi:hypothetical protein
MVMDYQEMYQKYQNALKLRELSIDENYTLLNEIFNRKILDSINLNTQNHFIPYLAGIKEVFFYVDNEASKIDFYRNELDRIVSEK